MSFSGNTIHIECRWPEIDPIPVLNRYIELCDKKFPFLCELWLTSEGRPPTKSWGRHSLGLRRSTRESHSEGGTLVLGRLANLYPSTSGRTRGNGHRHNIRALTSQLESTPSITLHTIVDSSPEPTITASGVVPGQALFDAPPTTLEPTSTQDSTRRYPKRAHIPTAAIAQFNEEIAEDKAHRKNRKPRKKRSTGSLTSEQSNATTHVSDSEPARRHDGAHRLSGEADPPTATNEGSTRRDVQPRRSRAELLPGASDARLHEVQAAPREGAPARNHSGPAAPGSESDSWDFSADHGGLVAQIVKRTGQTSEDFEQYSPRNLQAILETLVGDQTRQSVQHNKTQQVLPPQLKAQAKAVSNRLIAVGGGYHPDSSRSKQPETEPPSQNPHVTTTISHNVPAGSTRRLSDTPSPLPSTRSVPIDPRLLRVLDLPIDYRHAADILTQNSTRANPIYVSSRTPSQVLGHAPSESPSLGRTPSVTRSEITNREESTRVHPPLSSLTPSQQPQNQNRLAPTSSCASARTQHTADRAHSLGVLRLRSGRGSGQLLRPVGRHQVQGTNKALWVPAAPPAPPIHIARIRPSVTASLKLAHARQRARHEQEANDPNSTTHHTPAVSATAGPSRTPSSPDLMEDDEEMRKEAEAEANGEDPVGYIYYYMFIKVLILITAAAWPQKKKPAARNIHGNHRHILTVAKQHMLAYSIVEGPYQSRGLVKRWVPPVWTLTWEQELPDIPVEPPSAESSEVIVNGLPTGRCKIKDALRPLAQYEYGFIKPANTPEAVNHNLRVFRSIHPNNFHCLVSCALSKQNIEA
ncbi:hypothetical protein FRC12_004990 [Ceratobasidium sp. 428]|nr:hypothetical protein FRC12_004990 [Ceratobasidium sp. 428]